ncbi:MAG: alpha/beta hydrolase [Actinomycetota bacterium]|nr:alpha/beta hydrolase [Actinomycetota bacterium]
MTSTERVDPAAAGPEPGSVAFLAAYHAEARRRTEAVQARFAHELDLSYGAHERQRLDLYLPDGKPAGPVLVFLHGGGFRTGDHRMVGYHGLPYLEAGAVVASMSYRLLPEVRFPDMAADVEAGLNWLQSTLPARGADPSRVYLSGHSAGATLAALAALRPVDQEAPDHVRGLVAISGGYAFARRPDDETDRASRHYVDHLAGAIERVPDHTIVVWSDDDLPFCAPDGEALVEALRAAGGSVEHHLERGADHYRANQSFVEPDGEVALATKAMMGLR